MAKKNKVNYASSVDKNRDGRTTRSEAKSSNKDVSDPMDLNDDGTVTRSERKAYERAFGKKKRSKTPSKKKKTAKQIRAELRLIFDEIGTSGVVSHVLATYRVRSCLCLWYTFDQFSFLAVFRFFALLFCFFFFRRGCKWRH